MVTRIAESRPDDMHQNRELKVVIASDGDVHIMITQDGITVGGVDTGNPNDCAASLEFCVSGGKSRHTLQALTNLAGAIARDNAERPIQRKTPTM